MVRFGSKQIQASTALPWHIKLPPATFNVWAFRGFPEPARHSCQHNYGRRSDELGRYGRAAGREWNLGLPAEWRCQCIQRRNVTFLLLLVEAPGWNLAWNWGSSRGAEDFHEPINGGTIQQCFVSDLEHGYGVIDQG